MPVVAAVCPFGFFNLAPGSAGLSVTGTDWPGPTPNPDKFFKSHGGANAGGPGLVSFVLGLASARGPSYKGDTQLAVGIRTYAK